MRNYTIEVIQRHYFTVKAKDKKTAREKYDDGECEHIQHPIGYPPDDRDIKITLEAEDRLEEIYLEMDELKQEQIKLQDKLEE